MNLIAGLEFLLDTRRNLNVHKTLRRRPECLRPVSMGLGLVYDIRDAIRNFSGQGRFP